MPPVEGEKGKVKERTGIKISTLKKLLSKLPVLSTQIEAGNNSYKLKSKIRQIVYLLYQHHKLTKALFNVKKDKTTLQKQ